MPELLKIPDTFFQQGAEAIAAVRRINESNINAADIEKVLRSYCYLGVRKLIPDWTYRLSPEDQDDLVTKVVNRTQTFYSFRPDLGRTFTNLRVMETLAANGQLNPNVARPRAAQLAYEEQQQGGFQAPGVGETFEQIIQKVFGGAKQTVEAALRGLGLNIPFEVILIALVVIVFMLTRQRVTV